MKKKTITFLFSLIDLIGFRLELEKKFKRFRAQVLKKISIQKLCIEEHAFCIENIKDDLHRRQ